MKKNYTKKFVFIIVLVITFISEGQTNTSEERIPVTGPICDIPAVEVLNNYKNLRSEFVKNRMENESSNPCASFIVSYNGSGFVNPILPGQPTDAQIAFQFAVDIWASLIESPVPIRVNANFAPAAPGNLGSASPAFYREFAGGPINPFADTLYPAALYEKLIGEDSDGPSGNSIDINCNFNSNRSDWYFGTDGNPASNQFDFVSVVLHELGHGLGIAGFGTQLNSGEVAIRRDISGFSISGSSNHVSIWDTFVDGFQFNFADPLNPDTPPILNQSIYPDPSTSSDTELKNELQGGNLSINSPLAIGQNDGVQPETYAPPTFNGGSSYSHLDEATFNNTSHALMTPFANFGEVNHDPGNIILAFMEEMGWSLCQNTFSTEEFTIENIKVLPNPFVDSISIDLPQQFVNETLDFSVVDMNGKVVLRDSSVNSNEVTISNLKNLTSGLYFLTIESASSDLRIAKKIIKN